MTERQAEELGGQVRRDAQPSFSVYSSTFRKRGQPNLEGISADKLIRFLRSYTVFNADEIEGLPSYFYPRPAPPTPTLLSARQDRIDAFFAAIPSKVRRGGDRGEGGGGRGGDRGGDMRQQVEVFRALQQQVGGDRGGADRGGGGGGNRGGGGGGGRGGGNRGGNFRGGGGGGFRGR